MFASKYDIVPLSLSFLPLMQSRRHPFPVGYLPRFLMPKLVACLLITSFLLGTVSAEEQPTITEVKVGLGGAFKLGLATPVIVSVEGGDEPQTLDVEVIASDSEGFGVLSRPIDNKPIRVEPGKITSQLLYTRIGKNSSPVLVRLRENKRIVAKQSVNQYDNNGEEAYQVVDTDSRLMLELGYSCNLKSILRLPKYDDRSRLVIRRVNKLDEMPLDWIGYEGVDQIWLTVGAGKWANNLSAEDPRIKALTKWVNSGGKLVLSCGSKGQEMLTSSGPFAALVPGKFVDIATLRQTDKIEVYCGAKQPIPLAGGTLSVARIQTESRLIELSEGSGKNLLPLVVRSSYGFGEVTFVAFDLSAFAIDNWKEKNRLLDRLESAQYEGLGGSALKVANQSNMQSFVNYRSGLVTTLLSVLDRSFAGITTTPFIAIVGLILVYLMLIGPGDYWLTTKWLKRPEITWITFPLIVLVTSAGAYYSAVSLKGDQLVVNQAEVIDIDTQAGTGRGLVISHMFTPNANRFNLEYQINLPNKQPITNSTSYTSWLGKPGYGLGGMQGSTVNSMNLNADYLAGALRPEGVGNQESILIGMPVQVWSTRSLMHRWLGTVNDSVAADLAWNQDRLVEGSLTNEFGTKLQNCYLLAGDWAWRLGTLNNGETKSIDNSLSPIKIKTLIKSFDNDQDVNHLLLRLSLLGSRTNERGVRLGSQLALCDLSHYLASGGALLMASSVDADPSVLLESGKPLENDNDKHWLHYRFLIPVDE